MVRTRGNLVKRIVLSTGFVSVITTQIVFVDIDVEWRV